MKKPEVVKRVDAKNPPTSTSKYDALLVQIVGLRADDMLVVPRGCAEWPKKLSSHKARSRIRAGVEYHLRKMDVRILVEVLDQDRIGVSRTDV